MQATCNGEYIWSKFEKIISPHDFCFCGSSMWGVKPLSVLPGTKYKTVTLLKCCKRPQKPRNPSLQPGIQLSSALGLKSTVFRPLPPWLDDWQVLPWKELLYMGDIDLMMMNAPCFPQRESRSTCWLAEILILSLEDVSRVGQRVFWKVAKRGASVSPLRDFPVILSVRA